METIWRQAPFLRLVIPLILGVTTGFYLPMDNFLLIIFWTAGLICLFTLLIFAPHWKYFKYQMVFGVICSTAFYFIGGALALQQRLNLAPSLVLPGYAHYFQAEVLEYPEVNENSIGLLLKLDFLYLDSQITSFDNSKVLSYSPHKLNLDTLIPGDVLIFSSVPQAHKPAMNPGQFDYGKYLLQRGIAGTVYIDENVFVKRPPDHKFTFSSFFNYLQNYCVSIFADHGLEARELGVASALILGKRSLVLDETLSAFADAGAIHILAVSGLHVGIIYLVVIAILLKVFPGKKWRILNLIITLLILWFYAAITGLSPSVLRAATMFSFIAVGKLRGKRSNIYNMLAASAFLLIIINPAIVSAVGFQLSYFAVLGISYFFKPIYSLLIVKNWLADKIWSLFVVSFAAQLGTFPLTIYYFGQFPNLFLITNLVVIPAAMLGLYSGLLTILLNFMPYLSHIFSFFLKWTLWFLNNFIDWISSLPFAVARNLHFSLLVVLLIYFLIIVMVRFYQNPRRWNLWIPLLVIACLSAAWAIRKISVTNTIQISVLEGSKESNLILQRGREAIVFTNDTSKNHLKKAVFYLEGYIDKVGIDNVSWVNYHANERNDIFVAAQKLIYYNGITLLYDSAVNDFSGVDLLKPDMTIISRDFKEIPDSAYSRNTTYIIDSTYPLYKRKQLIKTFVLNEIPFWDMYYQGPFVTRLSSSLANR